MKGLLPALFALLCMHSYARMDPLATSPDTFIVPSYADISSNYRTHANNVFGLLAGNHCLPVCCWIMLGFTEPKYSKSSSTV